MRKRVLWLTLLLALVAAAADISGKWKADFTTPDGTRAPTRSPSRWRARSSPERGGGRMNSHPERQNQRRHCLLHRRAAVRLLLLCRQDLRRRNHVQVTFNGPNFHMVAKRAGK